MYLVYSLLLTLAFLVLAPRFLVDALRRGKYVAGFRERLGKLTPVQANGRPVIWIHCVSVGETQAARPLILALRQQFPNHVLVVSTITLTGQRFAREVFATQVAKVFYFPFDWRWTVRRALRIISPATVLIMETELWPWFLRECRKQQIPTAIVNGRISERSYRRYRLVKGFTFRVLSCLNLAVMQSEADAERIRRLGLAPAKIAVSGSLKFDAGQMPLIESLTSELRTRFNPHSSPLLLAASTHAPEERIIVEVLRQLRTTADSKLRLMIAPRHPERFAEVAALFQASGLKWTRRTAAQSSSDAECDVILLDTIGELPAAYPLAALVFVGGSIVKTGGHNILEPAALGACIVTGAHTHNFEAIVKEFADAGAIIQLPALTESEAKVELTRVFAQLLEDPERRRELGRRARNLVEQNLGATERTVKLITPILSANPTPALEPRSLTAQGTHTA